jgi:hypothetical protein
MHNLKGRNTELRKPSCGFEGNIKIYLTKVLYEAKVCIHLVQNRVHWRVLMSMYTILWLDVLPENGFVMPKHVGVKCISEYNVIYIISASR